MSAGDMRFPACEVLQTRPSSQDQLCFTYSHMATPTHDGRASTFSIKFTVTWGALRSRTRKPSNCNCDPAIRVSWDRYCTERKSKSECITQCSLESPSFWLHSRDRRQPHHEPSISSFAICATQRKDRHTSSNRECHDQARSIFWVSKR